MLTPEEFYKWERSSRDTIDVKRCYIDVAGDLVSGLLLSQIIFWFIPGEKGSKLRVQKEDRLWLAKGRTEWWEECRISAKQFDRAIKILRDKNLVEVKRFRFKGSPTIHIWLNIKSLLEGVNSSLTKGEITNSPKGNVLSPKGDLEIADKSTSLTETTTKSTSKTTTKGSLLYGEFMNVLLTTNENQKLIAKFGVNGAAKKIEELSTAIESKGYKYKSHYATILSWDRRDNGSNQGKNAGVNRINSDDADKYIKGKYGHMVHR